MSEARWYRSRYLWSAVAVLAVVACVITAWSIKERSEQRVRANEISAIEMLTQVCRDRSWMPAFAGRYQTSKPVHPPNLIAILKGREAYRGYNFKLELGEDGKSWSCTAAPVEPGVTGTRSFYVDQNSVVRQAPCRSKDDPPAGPDSPPAKSVKPRE